MRKLNEVLGGYSPKSPDEKRFVAKHKVKKHDDVAGNDDKLYKASNIKPVDRESPENHGYNPGNDEKVYEGYKGEVTRPKAFNEDKKQAFAKLLADKPKEADSKPALNGNEPTKKGDSFKRTILKQETEMRQLPSHIQSIVENIMRAKEVLEEAKSPNGFPIIVHGQGPAFTGTGKAPHPQEYHVIARTRTNLQDGDQSHKVLSSHGSLKTADQFAASFAKDGHNVMIMVPKKG